MVNNHNKNNLENLNEFLNRTRKASDTEVRLLIIQENLERWEEISPIKNLPISKEFYLSTFKRLQTKKPKNRNVLFFTKSIEENKKQAFYYVKHLIALGCPPSKIEETSIQEIARMIRGFGEDWDRKRKIFSKENKILIISGLKKLSETIDVKNAISETYNEIYNYIEENPEIIVVGYGDSSFEDLLSGDSKLEGKINILKDLFYTPGYPKPKPKRPRRKKTDKSKESKEKTNKTKLKDDLKERNKKNEKKN